MTTQLDQKIEELSTRNRTLVDKVSVLERELRTLQGLYARATAKVFQLQNELEDQGAEFLEAAAEMDKKLGEQVELNQRLSTVGLGNNTALNNQFQIAQQDVQQGLQHVGGMLPTPAKKADNG